MTADRPRRPAERGAIRDFLHYLSVLEGFIGARLYLVFVLTLLAALAEGVGIVMLLPLLQTMDGMATESLGTVGEGLLAVLEWLGLADSMTAVLLFIGAFFLAKGAFLFAAQGYQAWLRSRLLRELRGRLFDAYSRMRYEHYVARDTGHFINVITTQINDFLAVFMAMAMLGARLVTTVVYVALAFVVAWRFGAMAVVLGLILLYLFKALNQYVRSLSRMNAREAGHLSKLLIQALHAFKYLTATAQNAPLRAEVTASLRRLTSHQARAGIAQSFTNSVREPVMVVFVVLILVVQLVWLGQPLGPIMVSLLLFYRGLGAVLDIQNQWQQVMMRVGALEVVRDEFAEQEAQREPDGDEPIGPLSSSIRLEDVHFAYDPALGDVLRGLSLEIPARSAVAIVGTSGAGKSTLVDVLTLMLRPQRGRVLIDGVPSERIELASWRGQIGYVSQETVVFDDTIANNICLWQGDPAQDDELMARIRQAAERANIAEFIDTLGDGYHTLVGDRGIRLSGGQRQRLFIARELFKAPNLLILDEATSALDSASEAAIQRSIDGLKGSVTVVIIAHRLATIQNVDHVYVLDHGELIEEGGFTALRDREDSRLGRMVAMQQL
jgi:subfamily B ATP-binding cassette protein MsbA